MSPGSRPVTLGHWLRPALRRQRGALLLAGLSLAGVLAAELLAPWPLKLVVDHVLLGHPLPAGLAALQPWIEMGATAALWAAAGAMTVLAVVTGACAYAETYLCARVGQVLAHDLRTALFAHLARLPLSFHLTNHSSELIARVGADTLLLRDAFGDWLVKAVSQGLLVVGVLVVMALMDWRLAAGVALVMPLLFFLLRRLARRLRDVARLQRRQDARVAARLGETLPAMALVQAYGREDEVVRAFTAESAAAATAGTDNARVAGAMSRVVAVVGALCAAATVLGGGHLVLAGVLSPGGLLVFVAYVAALFKPLRDLGKLAAKFARARVAAERLAELAAATPEAPDAPGAHVLADVRGALALHEVSFAYPDGRGVLRAASLAIQPGEHVAIIGASGAGKSTLLRLLLRLEEPQSGHLSLDGHPIAGCTRASVRAAIGVSLQEAVMTGSSVRENIAFGCSGAGDAAVRAAALQAGADEFIAALPEGYDTPVGERGARLSGGQRQRLCLARALVRDPPVLVLDEPTAALDPASALALEQTLHAARRGRTTLFISHQFGALTAFDRVIEVRDGGLHDVTAECRAAAGIPLRPRKLG